MLLSSCRSIAFDSDSNRVPLRDASLAGTIQRAVWAPVGLHAITLLHVRQIHSGGTLSAAVKMVATASGAWVLTWAASSRAEVKPWGQRGHCLAAVAEEEGGREG